MHCEIPSPIKNINETIEILKQAKTIAVVGLSPDEGKDSNRVAKYLQQAGYKIVPIYPKEDMILGEKVYRSLEEVPFAIDIVNVFRKSDALLAITKEAIKIKAKCVWAQIGCSDDEAEKLATDAGLLAISNHCIMIERKRLLGD